MNTTTVHVGTIGLKWVSKVMEACDALLNPDSADRQRYCQDVANCFYNSIDEVAKANIAARQTIVALWPAMTSLVSALYLDAADVAYDHLGWAALFAMTSGGIPGYSLETPSSHFTAPDYETAKAWCNDTEGPRTNPAHARKARPATKHLHIVSHGLLLCTIAIYAVFLGFFLDILKWTILTWLCSPYWFGSLWYFLSILPTVMQAAYHLLCTTNTTLIVPDPASFVSFVESKSTNNFYLWVRVFKSQLTNRPYRLLVHLPPESLASGVFHTLVAATRLGIFVFGSVTQSSLILMPTPLDAFFSD